MKQNRITSAGTKDDSEPKPNKQRQATIAANRMLPAVLS
jgi:hypothetical protein